MAFRSTCPAMPGAIVAASLLPAGGLPAAAMAGTVLLSLLSVSPALAQALRAPSANSVAAGPTAERNSLPTSATTGLPGVTARQSTSSGTGSGSPITILGLPLRIAAPVNSPYDNTGGTGTFAGQPATGKDRVLEQSIDGAP